MLAKANRLLRADDFRVTMRTGRKVSTGNLVIYLKRDLGDAQARFGFVVAKTVGNAVHRNLVKRRLRAIARETLPVIPAGTDVVVRALPTASQADWNKLSTELKSALDKALGRSNQQ
jgi:ribonuclease P protein component